MCNSPVGLGANLVLIIMLNLTKKTLREKSSALALPQAGGQELGPGTR